MLQFQLDRTLLSKTTNHQLKPIILADVYKQTELEIPNLHKAFNVIFNQKNHPRPPFVAYLFFPQVNKPEKAGAGY